MSEPTVDDFHRVAMRSVDEMITARKEGDADMALIYARSAFDMELSALRRAADRNTSLPTRKTLLDSLMNLAREAFCPELSPPSSDTETEHVR